MQAWLEETHPRREEGDAGKDMHFSFGWIYVIE